MSSAPFQSGTTKIGAAASTVAGGAGTWRVRIRNSGPVAVRVGDNNVSFDDGFLLAPDDGWLEILTDDPVYAIGPPTAVGLAQGQVDYIAETR